MRDVSIAAVELTKPGTPEHRIGGNFRIRMSNGSYLSGVTQIRILPAEPNDPKRIEIVVLSDDVDLPPSPYPL